MVAVDLQFHGQLPDGVGLHRLHKAGVRPQLQRRQRKELRPRPEALGPVHGQQLEIRVRHRHKAVLAHQLLMQRREARQNGAVHGRRQQVFFLLRRVFGRLLGGNGSRQFLGACPKDQPAVPRLRHAKML